MSKYTSQFAYHATTKATRGRPSFASDAKRQKRGASSALLDSAVKVTPRGDAWNVISHRALDVKLNPRFRRKLLTSARHVYFHPANAVHNDLEAQSIEVPTKVWKLGFAPNAGLCKQLMMHRSSS